MSEQKIRKVVEIRGVVQGVGFRPTIHRLAREAQLGGSVQNRSGAVRLVLEGETEQVDHFLSTFRQHLPPQARIESLEQVSSESLSGSFEPEAFAILESPAQHSGQSRVSFPPDLAVCADCMREVSEPEDRRYGYPFTTCTNCGPRYTVINAMPYDRERTTLNAFALCDSCSAEYEDPLGRRFHAESIACPDCGPSVFLLDSSGKKLDLQNPLREVRSRLACGEIVSVRGVGGFLLAVDAFNRQALARLRERKRRPDKPFAVMARDLEVVRRFCRVSVEAERELKSEIAPIVILDVETQSSADLPLEILSPDTDTLGVMLPTSPLHWLLFEPLIGDDTPPIDLLVMTSGNRHSEPICISTDQAVKRLSGIVDCFLSHDREINLRADDSLSCIQDGDIQVWRRARGFAPNRLRLKHKLERTVLAMGAELKNTIALGEEAEIVLSPHIGDLETPEAASGLEQVVSCFPRFLHKTPQVVAVDLHPDMHSTILGRKIAEERGLELVEVQHHVAHAGSAMAEWGLEECLALVFDGTGLGCDQNIWGAELIHTTLNSWTRLATFSGVPLPGADVAVREPCRQVFGRLYHYGIDLTPQCLGRLGISQDQFSMWKLQIERGINTPITHAAGRVFDCFSALLDCAPKQISYEGQAAIRLEAVARRCGSNITPPIVEFACAEDEGMLVVDWQEAFRRIVERTPDPIDAPAWAMATHRAVAKAAISMIEYGFSQVGTRAVALSGGVFMNRILTSLVVSSLRKLGVEVFVHREVPPNDGGISAGQAFLAGRK